MITAKSSGYTALIPAVIGAIISIFFIRTGFAVMFFLLPLGFIGYGWGPKTLWTGLIFAVLGNFLLTLIFGFTFRIPGLDMFWDILNFSVLAASFAWLILPLEQNSYQIPGAYRLAIGASLCTVVFIAFFQKIFDNPLFYDSIKSQIESIAAFYFSGNAQDAKNTIQDSIDIDRLMELMKDMIIRGGALFSSIVMLFINRQLSVFIIRLFGGPKRKKVFQNFHVNGRVIWLLIFSIALALVSRSLGWTAFGIIMWNIIILCVLMYLAQGFGIMGYFMSKPGFPPFIRFIVPVVFVFLLFSPVINAIMLGIIAILGIVENWMSFRVMNISGPPSTPQA